MDEDYIHLTAWGPADEIVTEENYPRANITTYTWYFYRDNRQFTRSTDVSSGEVFYVDSPDMV
jgi:hypothetical protein